MKHSIPHIMIKLRVLLKGDQNLRWHCAPLAGQTKSNIPICQCLAWLLNWGIHLEGCRLGYLFDREDGTKENLEYYDPHFRDS